MNTSVTEVLDYSCPPQLVNWFKNNSAAKCDKIGAETARIGSLVDSLIQQDINDGGYVPPEHDEGAMNCLTEWESLKKDHPEFVPSVTEMQIEIKAFGVVGHPDFINGTPPSWGITDLKCTGGIRDKNWIQEATYARMIMLDRSWPMPEFIRTIRLPRDKKPYEWLEIRDQKLIKKLMGMFDSYLDIYYSGKIIAEHFRSQLEDQLLGGF